MYADEREEELSDLLTKHYAYLVNHISVTELMPYLISQHVITSTDKEVIEGKSTSVEKRGTIERLRGCTELKKIL